MEWLVIFRILAGAFTGVIALLKRRSSEPLPKSPRSRLRDDLEILRLLKETDHPRHDVVRSRVSALIEEVYEQPPAVKVPLKNLLLNLRPRNERGGRMLVLGLIALAGFSFWSWYVVRDGFSWWVIGTGFGALTGLGWIMSAYEEKAPSPPDAGEKGSPPS